jgi:hypothetical protein
MYQVDRLRRKLRRMVAASVDRWNGVRPLDGFAGGSVADLNGDASQLGELLRTHDGPRLDKWVHYMSAYEHHFAPYRAGFPVEAQRRPLRFLEIGVRHGGSLRLWRRYFGPDAIIYGIDIDPRSRNVGNGSGIVCIGSQDDSAFLRSVVEEMGGVDVILDDGSHMGLDNCTTFDILFPLLSDGGIYAVEDLHCAYWRRFGPNRDSFVTRTKALIDGMHGWYYGRAPSVGSFAKNTVSGIHFYDSLVFIDKRLHHEPRLLKIGGTSEIS